MKIFRKVYKRGLQDIVGLATLENDGTIQYQLLSQSEIMPHIHFEITEKLKQEAMLYFSKEQ